jgi:7-keto-8-aminopelargonate synthetase-like enzyme
MAFEEKKPFPGETAEAERAGVLFQTVGEGGCSGRYVDVGGQFLLNFASYDYLGLSNREELKQGAVNAVRQHGTQFPFPRAMLQSRLYVELEDLLGSVTGGYAVVAASTTLAHIAALPVVVEQGDAVIVEDSAHPSVHAAVNLLSNVPIDAIPTRQLRLLEEKLSTTLAAYRRVWFALDGMSPLHGAFAPVEELSGLMQAYPSLRLYVDEAHSTSWTGSNGRGHALELILDRGRAVVVLSLNKAFSAAGGALVFGDADLASRVRRGPGLAFSGAIAPPMLGAAVASARLHLSSELRVLDQLKTNIRHAILRAHQYDVGLADVTETPLFFVPCGANETTLALVRSLSERGIYACGVVSPLVPPHASGVRFMISAVHELGDIDQLMSALAGA